MTNPSFREDWVKIGKSARPVDIRSKELDNTAVPLSFEIYATIQSVKYDDVEKLVHKFIDRLTDLRIRQNREFFNVPPQIALDIFYDIAKIIDDAVVTVYENNKPVTPNSKPKKQPNPHPQRRDRFKFSMVGIKIGEYITFVPTDTEVKVASDGTKNEYTNFLPLSVHSCRRIDGIHQEHIRVQNISHTREKFWMIYEVPSKNRRLRTILPKIRWQYINLCYRASTKCAFTYNYQNKIEKLILN